MKKLKIVLTLIMTTIILAGCSGGNKLIGKWKDTESSRRYLEFFSDGTYASDDVNYAGSYSSDGNRLRLSGILMADKVYTYDISGNTLTTYYDDGSVASIYKKQ